MGEFLTPSDHLWKARWKRAYRYGRWLRYVPFVRLVGLNGSMPLNRMRKESDIDFYIATTPNRLYLTRVLSLIVMQLSGWRRYGLKVRGRLCLNRFATVEALEITPHNLYHAQVFGALVPIVRVNDTWERYKAVNSWMLEYPLIPPLNPLPLPSPNPTWGQKWGEILFGGFIGDRLEAILGYYQRKRVLSDPAATATGSRVFIRAHELCFHNVKNA